MALSRRMFVASLAGGLIAGPALATNPDGSSAYDFSFARAGGGRYPLSAYRGQPILIVNTATNCGFAGQFAALEQLWQRFSARGLMLLAVPSNDFGGQEPLDGLAIAESARQNYGATYAFAEKTSVRGQDAHPFYRWAAQRLPGETPGWNFHKYLIGRQGELVAGFGTMTDPISVRLVKAIGAELQPG